MQGKERRWLFLFPKNSWLTVLVATTSVSKIEPRQFACKPSWLLSEKRVRRKERKPWKESELERSAAVAEKEEEETERKKKNNH